MKLKNVWKYVALIGILNLTVLLFYLVWSLMVFGNRVEPYWVQLWLGMSLFLILFSVFIAAIGNIKEIIKEVIQFLKD